MKRILSLALALVMVVGNIGLANAASGNEKVDWLVEKGYVYGDAGTGDLRLNDTINRMEVAAMVIRVQGQEAISETLKPIASTFKDMNSPDVVWARGYVNLAHSNGIVSGYPDGTYKPKNEITYEEVITMLVNASGNRPDVSGHVGHWSLPFIQKALEIGILADINLTDYTAKATRGKVFEMVYNLVVKEEQAELETYKGIVVENYRAGSLDEDEITLIVFERGDNPENATLRYDKYSDVRITLPSSVGDVEHLLGKVVDITIDKNNNAKELVVDNTYSYLTGPFLIKDGEVYDGTTAKTYSVFLEDRFTNTIEKIFGAYHNDEAQSYRDLVRRLDRSYDGIAEFAKVTMKNNRVFFIDAFNFDDVAPVQDVRKSGDEIYIYSDTNNGNVVRFNPSDVVGFTEKDGFRVIDKEHIDVDDVLHIYDRDKALVRQDASFTGQFRTVLEDSTFYFAQIDRDLYQIRETTSKKPVYSIDGSKFFTLNATTAVSDLSLLRNEEVVYLLDINGIVQLIVGELEFDEGTFAIEEVGRRDVDLINTNGTRSTVSDDSRSILLFQGSNTQRSLSDFGRGDIVYLFKDGSLIDEMIRIASANEINTSAKKVAKKSNGDFDINLAGQRTTSAWIRLETVGFVDISSTTNLFIVEVDGSKVTRVEATTLEHILETAKPSSDLRAYVITERDFTDMNLGNSIRVGSSEDIAHTIIFTDYEPGTAALDFETIEIRFRFNPEVDDMIFGRDVYDDLLEFDVDPYANIPRLDPGDIVTLGITKDSSKLVQDVEINIKYNADEYEVKDLEGSLSRPKWIKLEDEAGVETELFVSRDVLIFGASNVDVDDIISYGLNSDGDIEFIYVR